MREFRPLDTARFRISEFRKGQVIPTAAVGVGVLGGLPLSQLIVSALPELGFPVGPNTAALLAVLISAGTAYLTRAGRRYRKPRKRSAPRS
jgi:hypothetical protein